MGKEDLIVDNPLLLTSLFSKGIFMIPDKSEVISEGHKLSIPNVDVLHIVAETGKSPYREETIPNTMNALTKSQAKWGKTFEILEADTLGITVKEYIDQVPNQIKIIFWGRETPHFDHLSENSHRLLILSMPSVMLASQESKMEHWLRIKHFF